MFSVQIRTSLSTAFSPLAANVVAAWRSGGFHCTFCGLLPFVFARHFLRGYCRRCAKPRVRGGLFYYSIKSHSQFN